MKLPLLLLLSIVSSSAFSAWQLDNSESKLSFISTKKADIAEVHSFKQLTGSINEQGEINFEVALASVDTNIAIRDQRMQQWLFNTEMFPSAKFTAVVAPEQLKELAVGQSKVMSLSGTLSLHGVEQAIDSQVLVAKLSDNKLIVSALQPLIINAKQFNLADGVAKLQEIAGLPSISNAVPISFVMTFVQ